MPQAVFEKKNVLVLGGAGFIGSHLCDKLVVDNKVICVDNFITGDRANIDHLLQNENFIFINEDVNNLYDLERYSELERFQVKFQGIQEIYNLACPTSPKNFKQNSIITAQTNSLGTIRALDLAVKYKAKLLHYSSAVVYGDVPEDKDMVKENEYFPKSPLTPRACYDEGKSFAETLVFTYREFYNIDAKIIRVFTTYGPRMPLFIGHMIPDFIVAALDDKPLIIYGDQELTTTLCYINDVIDATMKIMASTEAGPLNIGNPKKHKIADIAKKIIAMTGSKSEITYADPLLFMSNLGVPDISLAKQKIEWFPIVTLEKGLEITIEYAKANKVMINWASVKNVKD
ncbi:MAG: NAD-dependent epimerase/dehydratase family protein [Candidatus Buchananbacteria bacterium]|nr:NAD-dependent epimerase/dehydratase family protein [Candidatus Buchananbacteria bacterium]